MRIKLNKCVITAFDYRTRRELDTKEIFYNGKPLAADASFPYLGVLASMLASQKRCALSLGLASEKDHVFSTAKALVGIAKDHRHSQR